jgi:alpha-L-fucosidase
MSLGQHQPVFTSRYKDHAFAENSAVLEIESGQLADIRPLHWQTETSLGNRSWAYLEHQTFKTPEFVLHQLVDIVSKNGNLLLNVGPRPGGTVPDQVQQPLRDMGAWFQANGEAIYGTHPWTLYGEGPTKVVGGAFQENATQPFTAQDIRLTAKGNTL